MKHLLDFYHNKKISVKMLMTFAVFLLVPSITVFVWTYTSSVEDMSDFISDTAEQHYNQTYTFLVDKLDGIIEESEILASTPEFRRIIGKNRMDYPVYEQVGDMYSMNTMLSSYQNRLSIKKTTIYILGGLVYSDSELIQSFDRVEDEAWYQNLLAGKSTVQFYASSYDLQEDAFLARKIVNPLHYDQIACIAKMEINDLGAILTNADISDECITCLIDRDGTLIMVSNKENLNDFELDAIASLPQADTFTAYNMPQRQVFYIAKPVSGTDWTMVSLLPYNVVNEISRNQITTSFVILLVMIIFIIVAILLISNTLLRRLNMVTKRMRSMKKGDFKLLPANLEGRDEAGTLTKTYNQMVMTIQRLMAEQEESHQRLRKAEHQALQAQIKPHFLYNTLEMIGWLNRVGRDAEVLFAIESLAKFYKETLNQGKEVVKLSEEIDHIKTYMDIQSFRFENILLSVDLEDGTENVRLPKITLQPIVENALYHGILEREDSQGHILVSSKASGNDVQVIIEDNGVGMTPAQMESVLIDKPAKKGYAILNVNQRIQGYMGIGYGLSYMQREGGGTRVSILLPRIDSKEERPSIILE